MNRRRELIRACVEASCELMLEDGSESRMDAIDVRGVGGVNDLIYYCEFE